MMNKKNLPRLITAVSFVVFIVLVQACASLFPPDPWKDLKLNGENSKLLEGTTWAWNKTKIEFHPNGKLDGPKCYGSWERVETDIKLSFFYLGGHQFLEGKYDPDNFVISGVEYLNTYDNKKDFTMEFTGLINGTQRYVNGLDTALNGKWTTDTRLRTMKMKDGKLVSVKEDENEVVGYTFFVGNFITYKRYGIGEKAITEKLEKGTYTTDDKGTITFKVTHYYDRTEKTFLSKDEFTARQKAQGKTTAQINDAIKEYFPDRSVKYSIDGKALYIIDSRPRIGQFLK